MSRWREAVGVDPPSPSGVRAMPPACFLLVFSLWHGLHIACRLSSLSCRLRRY